MALAPYAQTTPDSGSRSANRSRRRAAIPSLSLQSLVRLLGQPEPPERPHARQRRRLLEVDPFVVTRVHGVAEDEPAAFVERGEGIACDKAGNVGQRGLPGAIAGASRHAGGEWERGDARVNRAISSARGMDIWLRITAAPRVRRSSAITSARPISAASRTPAVPTHARCRNRLRARVHMMCGREACRWRDCRRSGGARGPARR